MAIANIQSTDGAGAGSLSLNVPAGSGNDRVAVAIVTQFKGDGVNASAPTLNGVSGTLIAGVGTSPDQYRAAAYYWLDADLPSSSGSYTVAITAGTGSLGLSAWCATGCKQSAPVDPRTVAEEGASTLSYTLTADSGSVAFLATIWNYGGSQTISAGSSQTACLANYGADGGVHLHSYKTADLSVSHTYSGGFEYRSAVAFAVEPAAEAPTATKLLFDTEPTNTVVGATMAAVVVNATDGSNVLDTSFTGDVTIALQTGSGTLSGTLTVAAVAGVATFDDLSIDTLNTGAVLRATSSGLTQADSDTFNITAGTGGTAGSFLVNPYFS